VHHHITTPAKKAGSSGAGGLDVPRSGAAPLTQPFGAGQRVGSAYRTDQTHLAALRRCSFDKFKYGVLSDVEQSPY